MARKVSKQPKGEVDQVKEFRRLAHDLGADETEDAFDKALKKLGRNAPPVKAKPRAKKSK